MNLTTIMMLVGLGLLAALGVTGYLLKQSYAANGALEIQLKNADAVIKQREEDAKANAVAVAQLAQKLNDTETKVITVTEKIYAAPVTRDCVKSPSIKSALEFVQQPAGASAVPTPGGRQPPTPLQGGGAAAK